MTWTCYSWLMTKNSAYQIAKQMIANGVNPKYIGQQMRDQMTEVERKDLGL